MFVQPAADRRARHVDVPPNLRDFTACFQLRKDFLLVLLLPVWTGSSDERQGAAEDTTGT